MHCPKCSSYTSAGVLNGVQVDHCPACRGIWLDRGELSRLVGRDRDLKVVGSGMKETRYSCPRCAQRLTEVPYDWDRRLRLDLCAGCEGLWLDAGELEKITSVVSALQERYPGTRVEALQRTNRRREALSSAYGVGAPAAKAPVSERAGFLGKVYGLFLGTLGVSVVGTLYGIRVQADRVWLGWVLASFAVLIGAMCVRKVPVLNLIFLFGFAFIDGVTMSGVIEHYFGRGKGPLVVQALIVTTGVFLALSSYVWITKKDLDGWGPWLYGALSSLLLSGLMMLFFGTPLSWMIWTWVSAFTFCGYILHDTSRILLKAETDEYIAACLDLYLDFVNLFLDVLRILSELER